MLVHYSSVHYFYEGRPKNLLKGVTSQSFLDYAHYAQFCVFLESKEFRIVCNGIQYDSFFRT